MTYAAGETLIFTAVKAVTGFDATNTYQANWKCLNGGKADHYAILHIGPTGAPDWLTPGLVDVPWVTTIEIWQRYKDDSTSQTNIYGHVNNILAALLAKPHMGGADTVVRDSTIAQIGELEEMWTKEGGPQWLRIKMSVLWHGDMSITISE